MRIERRVAGVGGVVLALLAVSLVVGVVVSGVMGEPKRSSPDHVAIGVQHGHLVLFACLDSGVGSARVSTGAGSGSTVWSIRLGAGPSSQIVPINDAAAGYEVTGRAIGVDSDNEFNLNNLTDPAGNPLLVTVVVFKPSRITPGWVVPARGRPQPVGEWTAAAGCR